MPEVTLVLFHTPRRAGAPPLTALLDIGREALAERQVALFRRAGVDRVVLAAGRGALSSQDGAVSPAAGMVRFAAGRPEARAEGTPAASVAAGSRFEFARPLPPLRPTGGHTFGEALAGLVRDERIDACVVLGDGAVPRLRLNDARRLVERARGGGAQALTNNRYSSDVCAVADAAVLRDLPPLPSDNALPRWLEERAGFDVGELGGRERLALDLDTPLDLALLALAPDCPAPLRRLVSMSGLGVPRADEVRVVAADPRRELLVFGRSSSGTLAWLERHVRCRVRFLAEERGMRASSPLAIGAVPSRGETPPGSTKLPPVVPERQPRATLGRLLEREGPGSLGRLVATLADAAVVDTRVLLADRLGADEAAWPGAEDRFASDLLLADRVGDPWLRELTAGSLVAPTPIVLGGHSLVGPGVPLLLRGIR
ncbi:MAG TPA: hypothetical protein VN800_06635 [Candidatus Acidoferrales bacterium]|nr:hypothetical protein [Candidatus Acidoferrales bacterium]